MRKNIVERGRPQMTIRRMRIACRIPKATSTNSDYVPHIAVQLQQWSNERASVLRYTYMLVLLRNIFHTVRICMPIAYYFSKFYIPSSNG